MTKFKQFKDCDIISDMAALTLTLNVNETLHLRLQQQIVNKIKVYFSPYTESQQ